ncbi:MAG: beta-lactamase family protein [Oscillospiraceae bacterium]|nr:beta-lactamase family protein [Oscillospiraceae bacterium]
MLKKVTVLLLMVIITAGCADTPGDQNETGIVSGARESLIGTESDISDVSQQEELPDNSWKFDTPENRGANGELFEQLHKQLAGLDINAFVTVKDGYIIDEYYKNEFDENSVFRYNSCTKGVSAALIGIAVEQGYIENIDVPLTKYFPQAAEAEDKRKQKITIRHLLEHSSGVRWPEYSSDMFRRLRDSKNWVEFFWEQPMEAAPGEVFAYNTGGSHLLTVIIQKATGKTAYDFARENIFTHIGMDSVEWRTDPQGYTDGGNGIEMTARDAARFGQLHLDSGQWRGTRIIPKKWVRDTVKPLAKAQPNTSKYGYQWWIKPLGKTKKYDAYYSWGYAGQYIIVVPELNLVTAANARLPDNQTAPLDYFTNYVLEAF